MLTANPVDLSANSALALRQLEPHDSRNRQRRAFLAPPLKLQIRGKPSPDRAQKPPGRAVLFLFFSHFGLDIFDLGFFGRFF